MIMPATINQCSDYADLGMREDSLIVRPDFTPKPSSETTVEASTFR
jgi:hypothetical protein